MILQTQRLLLRDLVLTDAPALNEIERDSRVTRYMCYDPQAPDQTRAWIEGALKDQSADPRRAYDLGIVMRTATPPEVLIGRCGLGIQRPDHREAALWYELGPAHWGQGYAVEATSALLDFAFGPLGLHRVWADCDPRNTASCRVVTRLGMTLEGCLRENWFLKGEWCDSMIYGILDNEWKGHHGQRTRAPSKNENEW